MTKPPLLWLRCQCGILIRSENAIIAPRRHPNAGGKRDCHGTNFTIIKSVTDAEQKTAEIELARRKKKQALSRGPGKLSTASGKGTNRWDGVRSTAARPSRGSAGAPTLGKRR